MVKTVSLDAAVPGTTAQALFDLVYGDGNIAFLQRFHAEINNDPEPRIGQWADDERSVSFLTPVDAPAFIKRMVGKDVMRVVEQQKRSPLPGGGWQLASTPVPDMPGGAKFTTQAVFTFTDSPAGCQVHAVVTCSASGPYGLTGTIEAFMADTSKESLQDFMTFVTKYVLEQAPAAALALPAAALPAAVPAAAASTAAEAPGEQFYDAMELPLPRLPLPLPAAAAAHALVPSSDGLRFDDAVLLYLRYMCRTGDQTVGLLQSMELHVRLLQEKVAQLEADAAERRRQRRWLPEIPDTIYTDRKSVV